MQCKAGGLAHMAVKLHMKKKLNYQIVHILEHALVSFWGNALAIWDMCEQTAPTQNLRAPATYVKLNDTIFCYKKKQIRKQLMCLCVCGKAKGGNTISQRNAII